MEPVKAFEMTVDIEQARNQVERIAGSAVLRNGSVLQQLLRYLCANSLENNEGCLKESVIGFEVFGRMPGYDPKIDTIVRVQIHRLRAKLAEYYESEGAGDTIIVDIPRGRYRMVFEPKKSAEPVIDSEVAVIRNEIDEKHNSTLVEPAPPDSPQLEDRSARHEPVIVEPANGKPAFTIHRSLLGTILLATCLLGVALGLFLDSRFLRDRNGHAASLDEPAPTVQAFWRGFLDGDPAPILVYPNATFLLDETNDLFRFRQGAVDYRGAIVDPHLAKTFASNPEGVAKAGPLYYDNGYTGTGELESVAILSRLVTQLGAQLTVKRGSDLTIDDLKHHNVILLGSSFQNDAVRDLAAGGDFRFVNPTGNFEAWRAQIKNMKPHAGELNEYQTVRDTQGVLRADYALASVQRGIEGNHRIMLLGGLDTAGTKGSVAFVTSSAGIEALLKSGALSANAKGEFERPLSFFQAVLKVDLQDGRNVLDTHLITVHRLTAQPIDGGNQSSN